MPSMLVVSIASVIAWFSRPPGSITGKILNGDKITVRIAESTLDLVKGCAVAVESLGDR